MHHNNGLELAAADHRSKGLDLRLGDSVRSALLYQHQGNPLGVTVTWGIPERHSDSNNHILPVQLKVPVANVVLLPTSEDRCEMRLKLYSGVADENGDTSEIDSIPLGLRIAEEHLEAARSESFVYTHALHPPTKRPARRRRTPDRTARSRPGWPTKGDSSGPLHVNVTTPAR